MKKLALKGLLVMCLSVAALSWQAGMSRAVAAPSQGVSTAGLIIKPPATSSATTTPDACAGAINACTLAMLKMINADRAQNGLAPLILKTGQTLGKGACIGSLGHSRAMARSGAIWHINPKYPRASFPNSVCMHFKHAAENVGESASGDAHNDLMELDSLMMSEPHTPSVCALGINHACNILGRQFRHVGIGIYYVNGAMWLTEDFTN